MIFKLPPKLYSIAIAGFIFLLLIYLTSQQQLKSLQSQSPEPYPLDLKASQALPVQAGQSLYQTLTLHQAGLRQLILPYKLNQPEQLESLTIRVQAESWPNSLTYTLPAAQLATTSLIELPIDAAVPATKLNEVLTINIDAPASPQAIAFYSHNNPWLEPHRFKGQLHLNSQTQAQQLVVKPIFNSNQSAIELLSHTKELVYLALTQPIQIIRLLLFGLTASYLLSLLLRYHSKA